MLPQTSSHEYARPQPKKCTARSLASGALSPSRGSCLRGHVKSLAIGSIRQTPFAKTTTNSTVRAESPAEVTVSLSRSSFLSASSDEVDAWREPGRHALDRNVNDSFPDPYLDYTRKRPVKPEPNIPQNHVLEDSVEDFHVASQLSADIEGMHVVQSPRGRSNSLISAPFPDRSQRQSNNSNNNNKSQESSFGSPSVISFTTSASPQSTRTLRFRKEQSYWNDIVTRRTMTLGTLHNKTAEALFSLGHSHMRLDEFGEAMQAFKSSCKICKALNGPTHLSVARALDAYGLAALRYRKEGETLKLAKKALDEAFAIRFHNLGVWHVDTVETFNKIASVKMYMGDLKEACRGYEEVFLLRKAIFGKHHPSVAISAHSLANVHRKLGQWDASSRYFQVALGIYKTMYLPEDHPTVRHLLRDWKLLQRETPNGQP